MAEATSTLKTENLILSALPDDVRKQLVAKLEPVCLAYSQIIYEIDDPVDYVYFVNSGVISLVSITREGQSLAVAAIGCEGYLGVPPFLENSVSPYRMIAQVEATAFRVKADAFKAMCEEHSALQEILHRYAQSLIKAITQSTLCMCFHPLEARLCRWLLACQDNVKSNNFHLTQEFLSDMLGVRRAGVTVAAGSVQGKGLISYHRGHLTILVRDGLEAASCECYECIKEAYDWLRKG